MQTQSNSDNTNEQPRLLTVKEISKRLQCGVTSVYVLMDKGDLPYVYFLSCRRVEERHLKEFIARHRIGPRTTRFVKGGNNE